MYLKSIELQGFKSFPDKTVIDFKEGITVIVGPNGSGKSNIADAMRWVLGEVSSRSIRGTKMEDVVFGGSEGRKPSSFAQVSLTLDNSQGDMRLPVEYDTVTVTRRYFRGGDSEYLINGKNCRLKDIHKLFLNTGIGREGYSVIGQGKIAEIVSQKSEDRRIIFEEAAGITKFRISKNESLKKLEGTRENLVRLNDIISVLGAQVGPLEKEAEKARRYLEIYDEKKALDVAIWLFDLDAIESSVSEIRGNYNRMQGDLELAEADLNRQREAETALAEKMSEIRRDTERENTKRLTLQSDMGRAANDAAVAKNETENLKERISELAERQLKLEKDGLECKKTLDERLLAKAEREKVREALALAENEKSLQYAAVTDKIDSESQRADGLEERVNGLNEELTRIQIEISRSESRDDTEAEKSRELDILLEEHGSMAEAAEKQVEIHKASLDKCKEKLESATERLEKALEEKEKASLVRDGLNEKINALSVDRELAQSKAETYQRMAELFEGYSESTKYVMNAYKEGRIKGTVYAPVSQLLNVDAKYTVAIESALGAAMQNIVVEDERVAKEAIYCLKASGKGRTTFMPVTTVKPGKMSIDVARLSKMKGFAGIASDIVQADAKFANIVSNLLGRTAVFEDIDTATACAAAFGYGVRLVTLDGQMINAGGTFTGGSHRGGENGILSRKRKTEELLEKARECAKELAQLDEQKSKTEAQLRSLNTQVYELTAEKEILAALYGEENTAYGIALQKSEAEKLRTGEILSERTDITKRANERREHYEKCLAELENIRLDKAKTEKELYDAEEGIKQLNKEQTVIRAALEAARVRLAEGVKDLAAAEEACLRSETELADINRLQAENKALLDGRQQRLTAVLEKGESSTEKADELKNMLLEMSQRIDELNALYVETEAKYTRAKGDTESTVSTLHSLEMATEKARVRLENAEKTREKLRLNLEDEYGLTYAGAKEDAERLNCPLITEANRPVHERRQTELKGRIRVLGHVNVNAVEEYRETKEKFDKLTAEVKDLTEAEKDLCEVIERLEEEMKTAFVSAFEAINSKFSTVFARLFGGGTAELVLSDPSDVLHCGIEIIVAPPGKIIKNISLLSGGEQAFVAIAIYFSLLEVNPTPFIMLDEIESALDEVNVDRFAQYLCQTQEKTQFILISHRRGTMENAEKLYGVTMPVKGVSKVLSVDISEIGEKIGLTDEEQQ